MQRLSRTSTAVTPTGTQLRTLFLRPAARTPGPLLASQFANGAQPVVGTSAQSSLVIARRFQ
jgi:hypothetical protein